MFRDMNTEFRIKQVRSQLRIVHLNVFIHFVEHTRNQTPLCFNRAQILQNHYSLVRNNLAA